MVAGAWWTKEEAVSEISHFRESLSSNGRQPGQKRGSSGAGCPPPPQADGLSVPESTLWPQGQPSPHLSLADLHPNATKCQAFLGGGGCIQNPALRLSVSVPPPQFSERGILTKYFY